MHLSLQMNITLESPPLSWSIAAIAAWQCQNDATLFSDLTPCVAKDYVGRDFDVATHPLIVLSILLLLVWSFPTNSMSEDPSFILISIAKSASMQGGLYGPEIIQDFMRVNIQIIVIFCAVLQSKVKLLHIMQQASCALHIKARSLIQPPDIIPLPSIGSVHPIEILTSIIIQCKLTESRRHGKRVNIRLPTRQTWKSETRPGVLGVIIAVLCTWGLQIFQNPGPS